MTVAINPIVMPQQTRQRADDRRMLQHLPQFGHRLGNRIAGVGLEHIKLLGDLLMEAGGQIIKFDHVIAIGDELGDFHIGQEVVFVKCVISDWVIG